MIDEANAVAAGAEVPEPTGRAGSGSAPTRSKPRSPAEGWASSTSPDAPTPSSRRSVAIKLMRPGLIGEADLRRFRSERQIAAALDHPHIARLLDGGTTAAGEPYFVMEYVEGRPLLEFCRSRRLALRARLDLFRRVCDAVQYAHQHLVVHRDLKPGNILVAEDGTPKLLDFGIAKLVSDEGGGLPEPTATFERVLTPEYASPEQVRGRPVTTASDVYSLGVILYELVADEKPYRIESSDPAELVRLVCERDPERPSTRAAGLSGDLDAIVLKAMRKEPERRYPSAAALSDDLGRFLDGRPVEARRGSTSYRARKFVAPPPRRRARDGARLRRHGRRSLGHAAGGAPRAGGRGQGRAPLQRRPQARQLVPVRVSRRDPGSSRRDAGARARRPPGARVPGLPVAKNPRATGPCGASSPRPIAGSATCREIPSWRTSATCAAPPRAIGKAIAPPRAHGRLGERRPTPSGRRWRRRISSRPACP